jgi:hypothetical protein
MVRLRSKRVCVFIVAFSFFGCQPNVNKETVGLFSFPVRYVNNGDSSVTRFDSFYLLGTQKTEQALPFIMNFMDTMLFDSSVQIQNIAFLRYEEGLPTDDRFNENWAYIGHAESYMFFEIIVDNTAQKLTFNYRDGGKILVHGLLYFDEIKENGRRKAIQTRINNNIKY